MHAACGSKTVSSICFVIIIIPNIPFELESKHSHDGLLSPNALTHLSYEDLFFFTFFS
jgi:hypothetical protein